MKGNFMLSVLFFILFVMPETIFSQEILKKYVDEGLSTNLTIQQKTADYHRALWGLKEAKRIFGPDIDFVASYKHTFREPFLMDADPNDPVSMGLAGFINSVDLPNIDGNKIYFPFPNQYNAGFQLTQTVFAPGLTYNKELKNAQSLSLEAQVEDFKAELEAEICTAYFQYLQTYFIKEAVNQGLDLANISLRSVENLIANQKITKEVLYKAKSNVSNRETDLRNAENTMNKALGYFNFLLNRPIETPVDIDSIYVYNQSKLYHIRLEEENRMESDFKLSAIRYMQDAGVAQKKLIGADLLPKIQFGALAAYDGQVIRFDDSRRVLAQVQFSMKWNLFNSGTVQAKRKQMNFQLDKLQQQYEQQQQQLLMTESNVLGDIKTELKNYSSIKDSYQNAAIYYRAVEQKFQMGMASILELTEAEADLLQANIYRQKWYYQLLIKTADFQKSTGKKITINNEYE